MTIKVYCHLIIIVYFLDKSGLAKATNADHWKHYAIRWSFYQPVYEFVSMRLRVSLFQLFKTGLFEKVEFLKSAVWKS